MRKLICSILLSITLLGCNSDSTPASNNPASSHYSQEVIALMNNGYAQLAFAAAQFNNNAVSCKQNPDQSLRHDQNYWKAAMSRWQKVQWIGFGPIMQPSRRWQIQFWPDTKNTIGRKIQALLQSESIALPDLDRAGVIVQGLSALEYVLFDPSMENVPSSKRCELAQLIGEKFVTVTETLNQDWQLYRDSIFMNNAQNTAELEKILVDEVVLSLVAQLDSMINQKLAGPFGLPKLKDPDAVIGSGNRYFLEAWRANYSFESLHANIQAIEILLDQGLLQLLRASDQDALVQKVLVEIQNINSLIDQPFIFEQMVNPQDSQAFIQPLYVSLVRLHDLIKSQVTTVLNVRIGFNAQDGDS